MRSLMFDTEVIIIDPENEYQALTHALGGEYIRFHFGTETKINPFDLALCGRQAGKANSTKKFFPSMDFSGWSWANSHPRRTRFLTAR